MPVEQSEKGYTVNSLNSVVEAFTSRARTHYSLVCQQLLQLGSMNQIALESTVGPRFLHVVHKKIVW